jgi:putative SOS response-associated peptidase YedK
LDAEDLLFFANFTSENNDDDDDTDTDTFLSTEKNNEDQPHLKKQKLLDAEDLDA